MPEPLISVIMAAYNAQRFLDEAVESIRAQTLADWELIAIDDCSTDDTFERLQEWSRKDDRIRVFQTLENFGVGGARDVGLAAARGAYIAIMDADDIALPERFEKQIAFMQQNPDIIGLGTQTVQVDEDGCEIGRKTFPVESEKLYDMLYTAAPIQVPTLMINRSKLPEKFNWFERVRCAEDTLFFFKLLQFGSLANLPDCLQRYRYYAQSVSATRSKEMFFETWRARGIGRRKYGYRARWKSRLISGLQFLVISCLPNAWIHPFYRRVRRIMLMLSGHHEK
jgi:glycosyltransferase involved in cell wall biosynthesis